MTKFISIDKDTQEKKETVFTHYVGDLMEVSNEPKYKPKDYDNVKDLGYSSYYKKNIFMAWDNNNVKKIGIYFGTKGDEFN